MAYIKINPIRVQKMSRKHREGSMELEAKKILKNPLKLGLEFNNGSKNQETNPPDVYYYKNAQGVMIH